MEGKGDLTFLPNQEGGQGAPLGAVQEGRGLGVLLFSPSAPIILVQNVLGTRSVGAVGMCCRLDSTILEVFPNLNDLYVVLEAWPCSCWM